MNVDICIYGDSRSGNCYKIELLCAHLGIEYEWREVDILAGETRQPAFLAMNANGKIPLLALPDGRYLPESNAILCYLATGTDLAGVGRFASAEVLSWMFFEQYSHEPKIATSRFIVQYLGNPPERQETLRQNRIAGYKALDVMEVCLDERIFMTGDSFTIADIALYVYTHVADEGGFDLSDYPAISAWLDRIVELPKHVQMRVSLAA